MLAQSSIRSLLCPLKTFTSARIIGHRCGSTIREYELDFQANGRHGHGRLLNSNGGGGPNSNENAFHSHQMRFYAKKAKTKNITKPKVELDECELLAVIPIDELRKDLAGVVDSLRTDYMRNVNIRTAIGIADLRVTFEGQEYLLKELGQVSRKGSSLLVLNFGSMPDALKAVLAAITESGMNLNPQQEGTMIYVTIPQVTREHRESLVKNARTLATQAKEDLKKIGSVYTRVVKNQRQNQVSSDLIFQVSEHLQYLIAKEVECVEDMFKVKSREILGEER